MENTNILYYHKKLHHLVSKSLQRAFYRAYGSNTCSPGANMVIGYIGKRDEAGLVTYPREIQNHFEMNRSSTSELLKKVEKDGYIQLCEDPKDARMKKIVLTKKGKALHLRNQKTFVDFVDQITTGLTKQDLEDYVRISKVLIENIKEVQDD